MLIVLILYSKCTQLLWSILLLLLLLLFCLTGAFFQTSLQERLGLQMVSEEAVMIAYVRFLQAGGVLASVGWREVWQPSPQGGSRSLQLSEIGMEDPQEDPLAVHCFCVCSGSVLLRDLLVVSRSREHDLLSVPSICPRFSLCIFIMYRHILCLCFILL